MLECGFFKDSQDSPTAPRDPPAAANPVPNPIPGTGQLHPSMGCSCQGGRAASPLHEPPPPPSLQSPPLWTQGQTGPGGLGRLGSCRKGLREMTRTGQDVPHHKAAPEDDEERERTKISNISTSLEQVTGVVTTFPPSPQGAGGTSGTAPCAVPVPVPQEGSSWAPQGC